MFRHGQGPDHGRIFWWQFPVLSNGYGTRSMCSTTYSKTSRRTLLRQHRGLDWFRSKMFSRNDTGSATGPGAFCTWKMESFALTFRKKTCIPHIYPSSDDSKLRSQKYSALKRTEGCQLLENIIWISTCSKPEDNTVSTMWMWESIIHNFSFKTYLQTKWFLFGEVFVDNNLLHSFHCSSVNRNPKWY